MKGTIALAGIALAMGASPALAQQSTQAEESSTGLSTASSTNLSTAGSSLSAIAGIDYSSGDYGTGVDTNILVVPMGLRYRTGNLRFTATLPWLRINGSSAIVGGGAGGVIIDPDAPRTTRSGLGDLTLGVGYQIPEEQMGFGLDLSARVKLPTASRSRALGTGKVDVTVAAEVSKSFGIVTPFANVGYRMPGDPSGFTLHNAWQASGGASVVLGKSVLIASYDYRESSSDFARDSREIFGAFSTPLTDRLIFTLYGTGGLSKGAADYGIGSLMSVKF
ncbi:transporter [Sphingobium estronivorans]|uniref:transporter n=1 Tax=Sphingobium estronivorans TaxID=1577690 RepID=UPI00123A377E|nr:transporter [Sphingobium estronivorans]